MQLNLSHVCYTYPASAEPALQNITCTFPAGWTGIVGDNGGGKTTLALVACGVLRPDSGTVAPSLVSWYCAQDATQAPDNLEDFTLSYDGLANRLRRNLGLEDDWPWRYHTLSGGQQKRLQVACALWAQPDVLVMDEPTNHVDASTRTAIAAALCSFKGVGLLISHDRALLDKLCAQSLFVSNGTALMRPGAYSQAAHQARQERESALHAHDTARREQARLEREAQRRREEAARVASRRSARGVALRDSDAREKKSRYIVSGQDKAAGRLSSRMEQRVDKATGQSDATRVEKRYEADIWLDAQPSRRKVLVRLDEAEIALGDEAVLRIPPLHIGNTDHIGLIGDNGCGKTTLVRHLVARMPPQTRLLYIPQEPTGEQRQQALGALRDLGGAGRGRVLSIVAQLNSEPERILEGDAISPGEMRKLMLALGMLREPELIVMDEPTNHLDLGSTEALERVLTAYPGALLLVSHDAELVGATTSMAWAIQREAQGYRLFVG